MADPRIAKIAATLNAATAAARISIKGQLDSIGDDAVAEVAALFPDWTPGVAVAPGDVLAWDGTLVEVIQGHTTQADWTPDKVPALFKLHRTPEMTAWVAGSRSPPVSGSRSAVQPGSASRPTRRRRAGSRTGCRACGGRWLRWRSVSRN